MYQLLSVYQAFAVCVYIYIHCIIMLPTRYRFVMYRQTYRFLTASVKAELSLSQGRRRSTVMYNVHSFRNRVGHCWLDCQRVMYLEHNGPDTLAPRMQKSDILYSLTAGTWAVVSAACSPHAVTHWSVQRRVEWARIINYSPTLKSGDDLRRWEEARV